MKYFIYFSGLLALANDAAAATAGAPVVPQVPAVVQSMTSTFSDAVTYSGPTGSASAVLKSSTSKAIPFVAAATPAVAASYWLEAIKHQGISAFNANPASYQVFRNVKDFGAKGMLRKLWLIDRNNTDTNQVMESKMTLLLFKMQ